MESRLSKNRDVLKGTYQVILQDTKTADMSFQEQPDWILDHSDYEGFSLNLPTLSPSDTFWTSRAERREATLFAQDEEVTIAPTQTPTSTKSWADGNDDVFTEFTTNTTALPPSLGFDEQAMKDIIIYSILFVIAAVGNLTVFITLFRSRHRKSRVKLMMLHLSAADLIVTFIMIPFEIGWRITTQWLAGNPACKIFLFLRAFGLYSSSNVLVCISFDRYFAILHPLKVNDAQRRGKLMLFFAWTIAAVCSVPQSVIFHVDSHPNFPNFRQCVSFGFFSTQKQLMAYNIFCLAAMYFMPLIVIIFVYLRILCHISQKSKYSKGDPYKNDVGRGRMRLRRSDMSNIERARSRTLRMTVIIVLAFIWCWTPYVVMVMWYTFDHEGALNVDKRLQNAFFIMAVSNSCVNPLVYGSYTVNFRNEFSRCFKRDQPPHGNSSALLKMRH
ncbi:adipokinetic hormone/corazonin-related peptide receptor variant I-like isoform X2 [Oratosquilla oratoria]|uniref:adipokinetic hormone/corazonin-related peptide receptor variant I-like isoform X2 n=1 Tax=Oratosquilla oratoria TaxID=337810 RepID=UPI003F75F1CF